MRYDEINNFNFRTNWDQKERRHVFCMEWIVEIKMGNGDE